MTSLGFVLLADRGLLSVHGADARSFLQGLITCDVARITAEQAAYGALLTPQGKFLFDFFVVVHGGGLLLDTEGERLTELEKRLLMYRLRAEVTFEDASGRFAVAALFGGDVATQLELPARPGGCRALDGGLIWIDPRLPELGARAVLPVETARATLARLGFEERDRGTYERLRISLGIPDGSRDLTVGKATLLESGFDELHGVDFEKGCFVGQELTARMRYRGLVRKRLMPVVFDGTAPEPGTIVRLGDREAGEMCSSVEGHGLALLRLEQIGRARETGEPLRAGNVEVVPRKPDWVNF